MGEMRRREPDDGESWLFGAVRFQMSEGVIHRDDGALASKLLELTVKREIWLPVEEI